MAKSRDYRSCRTAIGKSFFRCSSTKEYDNLNSIDIAHVVEMYHNFAMHTPVSRFSSADMTRLLQANAVIFEGAQGALLDPQLGFAPHITKTCTTPNNAQLLLQRAGIDDAEIIGVTRCYMTRHGCGPFPTECTGLEMYVPEEHNQTNVWQGSMRVGWIWFS